MKVYAAPEGIQEPKWPSPYSYEAMVAEEKRFEDECRKWLADNGYNGPNSGKIVRFGVADGYAAYMLAEGRRSFLMHMPFGDAYQYRDVEFLPKAEILKRIKQEEGLKAIFGRK